MTWTCDRGERIVDHLLYYIGVNGKILFFNVNILILNNDLIISSTQINVIPVLDIQSWTKKSSLFYVMINTVQTDQNE